MKTKEVNNNKLTQWEKRVIIFKFIYSLIIDHELTKQEMTKKIGNDLGKNIDEYILLPINSFINEKNKYFDLLSLNLSNNWTIDRICYVDKAIIFAAMSEYRIHKIDKKIIIDQAIVTSKKYSAENSYKFINFILDKVLN